MRNVVRFGRFWYDFVVGDDWVLAVAVIVALGAGRLMVAGGVGGAWVLLPVLVVGALFVSLRRATSRSR